MKVGDRVAVSNPLSTYYGMIGTVHQISPDQSTTIFDLQVRFDPPYYNGTTPVPFAKTELRPSASPTGSRR